MATNAKSRSLFDGEIIRRAIGDSFRKLNPRHQIRNPVMFVVFIGSILASFLFVQALAGQGEVPTGFILGVTLCLWLTVLFANFAEAMAEGRGKPRTDTLRKSRRAMPGKKAGRPHA